jgi:hypothetical protein
MANKEFIRKCFLFKRVLHSCSSANVGKRVWYQWPWYQRFSTTIIHLPLADIWEHTRTSKLCKTFTWQSMGNSIHEHVRHCMVCSLSMPRNLVWDYYHLKL